MDDELPQKHRQCQGVVLTQSGHPLLRRVGHDLERAKRLLVERATTEDDAACAVEDEGCRDAVLPESVGEHEVLVHDLGIMEATISYVGGDLRLRLADRDPDDDTRTSACACVETVERPELGGARLAPRRPKAHERWTPRDSCV